MAVDLDTGIVIAEPWNCVSCKDTGVLPPAGESAVDRYGRLLRSVPCDCARRRAQAFADERTRHGKKFG